jgi:hypothetical protein
MKRYFWVVIVFVAVCVVWGLGWYLITKNIPAQPETPFADRGQFGDMFGGVTSLFAALAFAGALCALYMQSKELAGEKEKSEKAERDIDKLASVLEKQAKSGASLVRLQALAITMNVRQQEHAHLPQSRTVEQEQRGRELIAEINHIREQIETLLNALP